MRLVINKLSFSYRSTAALKDVTVEVNIGEVLSIVGPNGSGKSTLLKCIDRILKPNQGAVLIDGKDVANMGLRELSKMMGYVPQNSTNTFPFTVFDVVLMGRRPHIRWSVSERDKEIVAEILEFLGIDKLAARHLNELSGGEQQKVIVARALAQQPQILLLDEPTSNLDIKHQLEILSILRGLTQSMQRSVIVAMHDLNLASRFSDRMIMLKQGCIFAIGTPESVLTEENIETVYGVKSHVTNSVLNRTQVTPIAPIAIGVEDSKMASEITSKCK
ncbi:MAG: ABC transporter ATP-binding protein [archaeon]|nr:ABC transporter ATP-binding protein [archaeon]